MPGLQRADEAAARAAPGATRALRPAVDARVTSRSASSRLSTPSGRGSRGASGRGAPGARRCRERRRRSKGVGNPARRRSGKSPEASRPIRASLAEARGRRRSEGSDGACADPNLQQLAGAIAEKRRSSSTSCRTIRPAQIRGLNDYEFMDPEARRAVPGAARHAATAGDAADIPGDAASALQMTPEDLAEMRQMMGELTRCSRPGSGAKTRTFEQFMHKWGHFFGHDVKSLGRSDRAHAPADGARCTSSWRA